MNTLSQKEKNTSCFYLAKKLLKLAIPIMGQQFATACMLFINTMMAATLGTEALSAFGLVSTTFLTIMGFCWGIIFSVGILISQHLESGDHRKISLIFWSGIFIAVILTIPLFFLYDNMRDIWIYFGQDPNVAAQAQDLLSGLKYAIIFDLFMFLILQITMAFEKPMTPFFIIFFSLPFLVLFNTLLMPNLGLYGIGIGTSINYGLISIVLYIYLFNSKTFASYIRFSSKQPYKKMIIDLLKLGVPIGFSFAIEACFFLFFMLMMGKLGLVYLAASQVCMQFMWLSVTMVYGFTESVTVLVAKAYSERNPSMVRRYTYLGILLTVITISLVAMFYILFPSFILKLDSQLSSGVVYEKATLFLLYCALFQLVDSIRIVLSGSLRGLSDTRIPMYMTSGTFWLIGAPFGYILAFLTNMTGTGLWIALIASALANVILQYYRFEMLHPCKCKEFINK